MNIEYIEKTLKFYDDEMKYISTKINHLKNNKNLTTLIRETNALYRTVKFSTEYHGEHHETTKEAKSIYELSKKKVVAMKKNLGIRNYVRLRENLQDIKQDYLKEIKNHLGELKYYYSDITDECFDFFNSHGMYISRSNSLVFNSYCIYDSFNYNTKHEFFEELVSILKPNFHGSVRFELYSSIAPSVYIIKDDIYKFVDSNGNEIFSTDSVYELFEAILQWKK